MFNPAEKERAFQKKNIEFLLPVNEFIPVLKDVHPGADTNLEDFADTLFHLTEISAPRRADELAVQMKNRDLWTGEELRQRETR